MVKLMTRFREIVKEFEKKVHADKDFRIDSHYGLMRAIVANENIEVKSGDVKSLKIKNYNSKEPYYMDLWIWCPSIRAYYCRGRGSSTSNHYGTFCRPCNLCSSKSGEIRKTIF